MIKYFWRAALLGVAGLVVWSIVSINISDHLVELAETGDQAALDRAMDWHSSHPRALTLHAERLIASGRENEAREFLVAAVKANPADARPLMHLADIHRRGGEVAIADQMVEKANLLMPVNGSVQRQIAAYWYESDRLDLVVQHMSTALTANGRYKDDLFPILVQIADTSGARNTLSTIADDPPIWWEHFAVYAAKNVQNLDSIRVIIGMRKKSDKALITDRERNAYINRFKKDGQFAEAYLLWVNGLDERERQLLAYLYNGNFEQEFSNSGFGWHVWLPKNSGIVISTATTYGIVGDQALYLSFNGKRIKFQHLRQSLFLNPGEYRFSGRVRTDKLIARKGLKWIVSCAVGEYRNLGQSEAFLGTGDWRSFEFDIIVPAECEGQLLRLHSVGNRDVDHELKGKIWFDDLRIKFKQSLSG